MNKQVIVLRKFKSMRKGKYVAQGAHASVGATIKSLWKLSTIKWLFFQSFFKICVYVDSEKELLDIYNKAKKAKITTCLITDKGHTEFHGVPTNTAVAVGPAPAKKIDKITGDLPLL